MRSRRALASGLPATHGKVNELLHLTSGVGVPTPTPTQKPPFLLKLTSTMSGSALHVPVPALCSGLCTALSFSAMPVRGRCIPCRPPHHPPVQEGGQTLEMETIYLFVYLSCGKIHTRHLPS